MIIRITYESQTIPDYVNGQTEEDIDDRLFELEYDGDTIKRYAQCMDKEDIETALRRIQWLLNLAKKKEKEMKED